MAPDPAKAARAILHISEAPDPPLAPALDGDADGAAGPAEPMRRLSSATDARAGGWSAGAAVSGAAVRA